MIAFNKKVVLTLFCIFVWMHSTTVAATEENGLLAEYRFTQCECLAREGFSSTNEEALPLVVTNEFQSNVQCATKVGFELPVRQGIVMHSSDENTDEAFALSSKKPFVFNETESIYFETWLRPQGMLQTAEDDGEAEVAFASIIDNDSGEEAFTCSIRISRQNETQMELIFSGINGNGGQSYIVSSNPDELYHVICGRTGLLGSGEFSYFGCINEVCINLDASFDFEEELLSDSGTNFSLGVMKIVNAESFEIAAIRLFNSDFDEGTFTDTPRPFISFPLLKHPLKFQADEDEQLLIPMNNLMEFDEDVSVEPTLFSVDPAIGELEELDLSPNQLFSLNFSKELSSKSSGCSREDCYVPRYLITQRPLEGECLGQVEPLKVCINKTNILPNALKNTLEVDIDQETDASVFISFVPGRDSDDVPERGALSGSGLSNGGFIQITNIEKSEQEHLLFFNNVDGSCTEAELSELTVIEINSDGEAGFCLSTNNQTSMNVSVTYKLFDAASGEASESGSIVLVAAVPEKSKLAVTAAVSVSCATVIATVSVLVAHFNKKRNRLRYSSDLTPEEDAELAFATTFYLR